MTNLLLLLVEIVGFGITGWVIWGLKSTVDAQGKTLSAIGEINRTVLEVFKVLEPERWAKEVRVHKQLADEKAAAFVEQERRKAFVAVTTAVDYFVGYVGASFVLMAYVPAEERAQIIESMEVKREVKDRLLQQAADAPDWSRVGPLTRALLDLTPLPPPPSRLGGNDPF